MPLSQGLIFTESMLPTVTFQSDFTPLGRQKAVHGDGVVCGVRLEIDEDARSKLSYTGLLWHGSDTAVLRLSSVLDPSVVGGPVPSIAVKFFKDAALSANVVALNSEAPQVSGGGGALRLTAALLTAPSVALCCAVVQLTTTNAFAYPLATQFVALPQAILTKFETVTSYPNFTGTSQLAYVRHPDEQQLNLSARMHSIHTQSCVALLTEPALSLCWCSPWQLVFVPNPVVQRALPEHYAYSSSAGYYEQFLPPAVDITGLVMYFVYAVDLPGEEAAYLGALRATTPFYRSDFGDRTLFFKHTRTEEDIQFRPEFGVLCPVEGPTCSPCPQTSGHRQS